jgi:hypothetical protein
MRWKPKHKPIPENGEKRIIKRFLIFPERIEHEVRWLEFAKIEQVYHATRFTDTGRLIESYWFDNRWINP